VDWKGKTVNDGSELEGSNADADFDPYSMMGRRNELRVEMQNACRNVPFSFQILSTLKRGKSATIFGVASAEKSEANRHDKICSFLDEHAQSVVENTMFNDEPCRSHYDFAVEFTVDQAKDYAITESERMAMTLILSNISMRSLKQRVSNLDEKVVKKMKNNMAKTSMTPGEYGKSPSLLGIDVVDAIVEEKESDDELYVDEKEDEQEKGVLTLMDKGKGMNVEGTEGDVENGLVIEMAELDEASKQVNISQPGLIEFQESTKL